MKYFENSQTGEVFAYDETDPTQIPYMDKAIADGLIDVTNSYPTLHMKLTDCVNTAKGLISAVDWSVLPDVDLANKQEFILYRATIRNLIINPVAEPVWPAEPSPVWSN